jgi:hypothetical protein
MEDDSPKQRWLKTIFSVCLIAFCLGTAVAMGFDTSLTTKVAEIVADGLITTSMFVAVSFLAADSVDTSGLLHKIGNRMTRGGPMTMLVSPVDATPPDSPSYNTVDPDAKG